MKSTIGKFMMIAAAAVALFAAVQVKAAPAGAPTPVEEQNLPAKTAVDVGYLCSQNTTQCTTSFAVPAGMRLVIESYVGGIATASTTPLRLFFSTSLKIGRAHV